MSEKCSKPFPTPDEALRLQMFDNGVEEGVKVAFTLGVPPLRHLQVAADMMTKAAERCNLSATTKGGLSMLYGPALGDLELRHELATYLTKTLDQPVDRDNLQLFCGATHAIHVVTTVFFKSGTPVFIENPCYHASVFMLRDDLHMKLVPVPTDENGMNLDELERLVNLHKVSECDNPVFNAMIYSIPIYHNPAGFVMPPDRCRRLVEIARKYNLLLFSDDVYQLLHYDDDKPVPRPLDFDNEMDQDYQCNVLACGSFSKTFGPGLRLGWIEAKGRIIKYLKERAMLLGSGGYNHYVSVVFRELLKSGEYHSYKEALRADMKDMRDFLYQLFQENLPEGCNVTKPRGGFFMWLSMPEYCNAEELNFITKKKYQVTVGPGLRFSADEKFNHCGRVSFAFFEKEDLADAVRGLCAGIREHIADKKQQLDSN